MNAELNTQLERKTRKFFRYYIISSLLLIAAAKMLCLYISWLKPFAVLIGCLYMLASISLYSFVLSIASASAGLAGLALVLMMLKFPLLLVLFYALGQMGEGYICSALVGTLVFIPASFWLGFSEQGFVDREADEEEVPREDS